MGDGPSDSCSNAAAAIKDEDEETLLTTNPGAPPSAAAPTDAFLRIRRLLSSSMSLRRFRVTDRAALFLCRVLQTAAFRFVGLCSALGLLILLAYWFYDGACLLVLLHLAAIGILYSAQDRLLFYPDQPPTSRLFVDPPSNFGLPYESVTTRTEDGVRIHMFLIRQPPHLLSNAPTVIYFHGNAGNIGHRLANAHGLYHFCKVNVLLVEYRGFGKSQGQPSESGLYRDARAALDYVFTRSDLNQQRLVVFGRSLGGAVAIRACSVPSYASRVACLVVENTFTSIQEMAFTLFDTRAIHYVPEWCYKNKFRSKHCIGKVEQPTLFLVGLKDALVPPKMMLQLYDISGSRMKRLGIFQNGTHNETWQCQGYYKTINQFFLEVERLNHGKPLPLNGQYTIDDAFQGDDDDYEDNS